MAESIADLYIEFRAVTQPAIAGFDALAAAGEAMATKIDSSIRSIDASVTTLGTEMQAAAGRTAATANEMAAANERAAASFKAESEAATAAAAEIGNAERTMAEQVTAATNEMVAAEARWAEENKAAMAASKASVAENSAAMAKWRTDTEAAMTGMVAAEGKAAKAAEDVGKSSKLGAAETALAGITSSKAFKGIGLAAAAAGIESVKMASTFSAKMELIATQAHAPQQEVDTLKQKVLDLAPAVGIGPDKLAEALYHLESVGLRGDQAMGALAASAKVAQIGIADLDTVAFAMSGVMSVGMKDVQGYADGVAFLNTIVGQGDMTMQGLAKAIGTGVLPAFKDAQLGMADFGAALTTLTDNSVPPEVAANHLKTTIQLLQNQSGPATKALGALGIGAGQLGKDLASGGLLQALEDVKSHMENFTPAGGKVKLSLQQIQSESKKYYDSLIQDGASVDEAQKATEKYTDSLNKNGSAAVQAGALLSKAFGGARSAATMETLVEETQRFTTKLHTMSTAEQRAAKLNEDWGHTQEQTKQKIDQAKASVETLGIEIGLKLAPYANKAIDAFGAFAGMLQRNQTVVSVIAGVIGSVLVMALTLLATRVALAVVRMTADFVRLGVSAVVNTAKAAAAIVQFGVTLITGAARAAVWSATWIANFLKVAVSAVAQAAQMVAAWVAAGVKMVADAAAKGAVLVATYIGRFIAIAVSAVAQAAITAGAWIAANLAMIVATGGIVLAIGLVIAAGVFLVTHWQQVKQIAGQVWDWIKDHIAQVASFFGPIFAPVIAIGLSLIANWQQVQQAAGEVWDWIKQKFEEAKNAIVNAVTNMAQTIQQKIEQIRAWVQQKIEWIKSFFSTAGSWLVSAGRALVDGLWNGIQAGWSWLTSQVQNLAHSLLAAAKAALGIHSPSKHTYSFGKFLVLGLANAVNDHAQLAITAARSMATRVVGVMQGMSTTATLNTVIGGGVTGASPSISSGIASVTPIGATATAAGDTHLHFNVQGSIWTTRDLVKELQQELLRHGIRNVGNATNYAFG